MSLAMHKRDIEIVVWIDLETTGLDFEHDHILEVAAIGAHPDMSQVWWEFNAVVKPADPDWRDRMLIGDDRYVWDMHTGNGLLDEVEETEWDIAAVDRFFSDTLAAQGRVASRNAVQKVMLAGSGVGHFDRRMVQRDLPLLENLLHYRNFDIGNIRQGLDFWNPDQAAKMKAIANDHKDHRALSDIRGTFEEARFARNMLRGKGLEPLLETPPIDVQPGMPTSRVHLP